VAALIIASSIGSTAQPEAPVAIGNNVLAHAVRVEQGLERPRPHEARLSSGLLYAALAATGELQHRAALQAGMPGALTAETDSALMALQSSAALVNPEGFRPTVGCPNVFASEDRTNIRVNQDCSLRRQAEEVIAVNPTNPSNLIAGQNDSRVGFNHCGYDFSFDGGRTWGDMIPPFYNFILGDGHTADACSDPTATFDTAGNAYIAGILFDIRSPASAFIAMKSNAGIGGAYYHTPTPGPFQVFSDSPAGVIASDNDPNIAHDKEFIVADAHSSSPKRNNVYATWTRFNGATGAGVGGDSPIYFSQSTDGGATWSAGIEISGAAAFCTVGSGEANANACDQNQGSDPIVGPDGTVYVSFGNGNTSGVGINQILMVSCPAKNDCSNPAGWTAPSRVADLITTEPVGPNATTACAAGRQCLPPNGYRMDPFVEISISVDRSSRLYVTWADFRNGQPNCQGNAATAVPPCDNDVFYAYSTNGGATWSGAEKLTPAGSAQWMPWSAVTDSGETLWVAYYDRSYGNCEHTGCNDITLAQVRDPATKSPKVSYRRLTTASMPNLLPSNNPIEAGFLGDYMWVTLGQYGNPLVVWADTRGRGKTVEEDIYLYRAGD
jgi:hypothetical protein